MSDDVDQRIGEGIDRVLGDHMGLHWDRDWHPGRVVRHRRRQRWGIAAAGLAAALGVLAAPVTAPVHHAHDALLPSSLAAPRIPAGVRRVLAALGDAHPLVDGMAPVYASYPVAVPTGRNYAFSGPFRWHGLSANSVSIQVNNRQTVLGGLLFAQGQPVYSFSGASPTGGTPIAPPALGTSVYGQWIQGGQTPISGFSAAGSHVYLTRGNTWADIVGGAKTYWAVSPGQPAATVTDQIAGLPAQPNQAVLMEEGASGLSRGFVTQNGGRTWSPWAMGANTVSDLIAIHSRYWAIVNGTLAESSSGSRFVPVLSLNTNRWQGDTFAVNPANPQMAAVALIPISGDGIGPVLETFTGGKTWQVLPHFPPFGAAPSSMAMTASGDIAALVNLSSPVLVTYRPSAQQWQVLPVPVARSVLGVGQLAEDPQANLLYGAPGGTIYRWVAAQQQWQVIKPPSGAQLSTAPATPLQAIGTQQI